MRKVTMMATIFGKNPSGETIDVHDGVTNSADVILGNAGNDTIFGLGGDDVLKGGGGADFLVGGSGIDTATYGDSSVGVTVSLELGVGSGGTAQGDTLIGIENLAGSDHEDTLVGNGLDNKLEGAGGNDYLVGGGGADKLMGGDGDDVLVANHYIYEELETFDGGEGIDTVVLSPSLTGLFVQLDKGTISGALFDHASTIKNVENVAGSGLGDLIIGDGKNNYLSGGGGQDTLDGLAGNDTLDGGVGNDVLIGRDGSDTLIGGFGADTFKFESFSDSIVGANDTIMDFETGVDKLHLSSLNFQAADLLTLNQMINGAHYSSVGIDANHNGQFENGEFAVAIKMAGNAYIAAGDLML